MRRGVRVGVDVGSVRVGVAICDPAGILASPLVTLRRDPDSDAAAPDVCLWTPQKAADNANLRDVGTPATKNLPTTGTRPMTVTTNQGTPITVELDV